MLQLNRHARIRLKEKFDALCAPQYIFPGTRTYEILFKDAEDKLIRHLGGAESSNPYLNRIVFPLDKDIADVPFFICRGDIERIKPPFIKQDECLFVFYQNGEHYGYAGPIFTVADVIAKIEGTDDAVKIVRYDIEADRGENVTEEIAEAVIRIAGDRISEHSPVDPWLESSESYQNHLNDLAIEAAEDALYGSYADQHRLRRRQKTEILDDINLQDRCANMSQRIFELEAENAILKARIAELETPLQVLENHPTWSLDYHFDFDDAEEECWRITKASGPVNDREWEVIATGITPLEVLARAAFKAKEGV